MSKHDPFMLDPELIKNAIVEIRNEEVDRGHVCKDVTEEEHAVWRFFQLAFLGAAFVSCVGVSWGMASLLQWTSLALFLTWFFWIVLFLGAFVYVPHLVWWAYKRGAFDD